ncbi:putative permease [Archaeoglobus sulfaticallidus PM70-1]|uniref:Probable membrane transporter protein n=1 Tax=Archaeoglobus sulfaticallidus PM70-1 TaxID=387631 RepID=N0BDX3_9EURY|nr:sulfite exporter TauE/SafE family protein [Archaeoglobus sulfaticallidus]AGK60427.1 putative permease [Archaeoglobus sulfaticallidus PM70-1]
MGGFAEGGSAMTPDMFIHIGVNEALFLLALGFFGGMLSGFIGSGGAFVLTPGMMSIGVPGPIAVASNMCHKFPKAMIGAWRRKKVGHLDVKLAILMAFSAILGVQVGIQVQKYILEQLGPTGTNLYVTIAFLIVLPSVAALLIRDVFKAKKYGIEDTEPEFAKKLEKKFRIPPMIKFDVAGRTQSLWLTIPLGFATGFLAATIAVGGFIGVPSMIYVIGASSAVASGTELGIAFVMGSTGTFTWAYLLGAVDFRLTTLILATSLIGVQIGAVGTTYVRQYYIKLAMAVVMLLVTVSRAFAVPGYLVELGWLSLDPGLVETFNSLVFPIMIVAMVSVTPIVIVPMLNVRKELSKMGLLERAVAKAEHKTGGLVKRMIIFGILTGINYYFLFRDPNAWPYFITQIPHMGTFGAIAYTLGVIALAIYWSIVHGSFAHNFLDLINITALKDEVAKRIATEGYDGLRSWAASVKGVKTEV